VIASQEKTGGIYTGDNPFPQTTFIMFNQLYVIVSKHKSILSKSILSESILSESILFKAEPTKQIFRKKNAN
jgi:hypothetical protein